MAINPISQKTHELTFETRKFLCENLLNNASKVGNKKYAFIPFYLLNIEKFQREEETDFIKDTAENYREDCADTVVTAYTPEEAMFNVLDGQQHSRAALLSGREGIECEIKENKTISQQIVIYEVKNIFKKKIKPSQSYKANLMINLDENDYNLIPKLRDMVTLDKSIKVICDKYGVEVNEDNNNRHSVNTIKSPSDARKIMTGKKSCISNDFKIIDLDRGKWAFENVVKIICESGWNNYNQGFHGDIMYSIAVVFNKNQEDEKIVYSNLLKYFKTKCPELSFREASYKFFSPKAQNERRSSLLRYFEYIAKGGEPVVEIKERDTKIA